MSNANAVKSSEVRTGGKNYAGWRGALLAELALSRLSRSLNIEVFKPERGQGYDFLIATAKGLCIFVEVRAFSSMASGPENPERVEELRWRVPAAMIRHAHQSRVPVLLFLFDADTEHGRFLRLNEVPLARSKSTLQTVSLPRGNTINEANLRQLLKTLEASPANSR